MAKIDPNEPCPCGSDKLFKDCHGPLVKTSKPPTISKKIPLQVIPEPDPNTRAVFEKVGDGTVIISGNTTEIALCCGFCGAHLIVGLAVNQVAGIVIKCNKCKHFNDTPPILNG